MNSNLMFETQRKGEPMPGNMPGNISLNNQQNSDEARIALFNQLTGGDLNTLALLNAQQQRNLTFTTQDAAQRSVMEVLARHNTSSDALNDGDEVQEKPSEEGINYFNDNDVLSGRGGGTNVHPGNRHFRDLINLHRRAYLKARKNDKPAISRAIVRGIRENNGAFLKRDEKTGLWFEIGDDAAREKTSQALRQRAPEMRKILFESEREQARQEAEDQLRQQQHFVASGLGGNMGGNAPDLSVLGGNFNLQGLNQGMNQQTRC
ncbi:hypothetical protein MHU86_23042 [Fragilaria crotonensis]|nr:hypothetical protein MHU86_23042 [Fragilaria crotonensis]